MKFLSDLYSYRNLIMKASIIGGIYSVSNCIGNKMYGSYFSEKDLMNVSVSLFNTPICMWSMTHFIYHFIIAYEYSIEPIKQQFGGFYWEFFEEYVMDYIPGMKSNCEVGTYQGNYWRAEMNDIYMNILGMLVGLGFKKYVGKAKKSFLMDSLILTTLAYNIGLHVFLYFVHKR